MPHLNSISCIDDFLDIVVLENFCTQKGCSTCGAAPFRAKLTEYLKGLAGEMARQERQANREPAGDCRAVELVDILIQKLRTVTDGSLVPTNQDFATRRQKAIDHLLMYIWDVSDPETRELWMCEQLHGTKVGGRYQQMLAHHKAKLERGEDTKATRERKAMELRDRIYFRSKRKEEIDRIWYAKHPRSGKKKVH